MIHLKHQTSLIRWLQHLSRQWISKNTHQDVLVEEGHNILSMALKWHKVSAVEGVVVSTLNSNNDPKLLTSGQEQSSAAGGTRQDQPTYKAENEAFFYNMLQEATAVYSIRGIISLIDSTPPEVMTSKFCTFAIANLFNLEANRFTGLFLTLDPFHMQKQERILKQLVERLVVVGEPGDLMHVAHILLNEHRPFDTQPLVKQCLTQIHTDITNGVFSLRQILQTMMMLSSNASKTSTDLKPLVRSMWVGLQMTESQIDRENLLELFECLELVPDCSGFLIALIDRVILLKPIQLRTGDVMKILKASNRTELYSPNVNKFISRWVLENIQMIDKTQLSDLLLFYSKEQKHDAHLEEALLKHLEEHAESAVDNSFIFRRIAQYLTKHKINNPKIMAIYEKILEEHVNELKPVVVRDIYRLFGEVMAEMPPGVQNVIDQYLETRFYDTPSYVVISLLFTNAIADNFNPKLIPVMLDARFQKLIKSCYSQNIMKLLTYDQGMRFKFQEQYQSPFENFDASKHSNSMEAPKITQVLVTDFEKPLKEVLEERGFTYKKFVILDQMPKLDLFLVDILAYPSEIVPVTTQEFINENKGKLIGVLILRMEDLVRGTDELAGRQRLRRNYFEMLGIRCVYLREDFIQQLKHYPNRLKAYIRNAIEIRTLDG